MITISYTLRGFINEKSVSSSIRIHRKSAKKPIVQVRQLTPQRCESLSLYNEKNFSTRLRENCLADFFLRMRNNNQIKYRTPSIIFYVFTPKECNFL